MCVAQRQVAALRQQLASLSEGQEGAQPAMHEQGGLEQAANGHYHEAA